MCVIGINKGLSFLTGSEDTMFKVVQNLNYSCQAIQTKQTFSLHEASIRAFGKCKLTTELPELKECSHLVVTAGSKM